MVEMEKQKLKVLITIKTHPIPSQKYDELVCTAGVTETGDFVRLYPVNFRDLPFDQKYRKYQWIEVVARKHTGRDSRRESYRPDCDSIRVIGEPIETHKGDWSARAKYVLARKSRSMEDIYDQQKRDRTSLGIFKPKKIHNLIISKAPPAWPTKFLHELKQIRLFESRKNTMEPPRKVPYKFHYLFECDDTRCHRNHRMMIEDWEVGALFWRLVDKGESHQSAAEKVRKKFLDAVCAPDKDTYFYVGTVLAHPKSWLILGAFYPKKTTGRLF